MSVSRFKVVGRIHMASHIDEGTVIIDRGAGLFSVRAKRRQKVHTLPLSTVAEMVVLRCTRAELFERRMEKARRKKLGLR
jgi:hypothetical protein